MKSIFPQKYQGNAMTQNSASVREQFVEPGIKAPDKLLQKTAEDLRTF